MKCAVVISIAPDHLTEFADCRASIERAWAHGAGPFTGLDILPIEDADGVMTPAARRNRGMDLAHEKGCEWIFFLDARDLLNLSAFADFAVFHDAFDAVWGNICVNKLGTKDVVVCEGQITKTASIEDILRSAPDLTLRMGHFVRTGAARAVRFDTEMEAGADYKYYLDLWEKFRCAKVAHIFSIERRAGVDPFAVGTLAWFQAVDPIIAGHCKGRDLYCEVAFDDKVTRFALTNPMDIIQKHHVYGRFFEIDELQTLKDVVGTDKTIVEVGANIGNHLAFYAQHMNSRKIFPFEPNPDSIDLLNRNIKANGLESVVDTRGIGIGAGAQHGQFSVVLPIENNLGAARLSADEAGQLEVFPLDERLDGEAVDFIKIDVEGMEFEVLEGAAKLIERNRPILMVEVFRNKIPAFERWCAENRYNIRTRFSCVNAVNFLVVAA